MCKYAYYIPIKQEHETGSCPSSVHIFTTYQLVSLNKSLNYIKPQYLEPQS